MNSVPTTTVIRDKRLEPVKGVNGQFYARADYRYKVDGDFYVGDKVLVFDFYSPMADYLLAVMDPIVINIPTVVYYNKYKPQDSFLIKSIPYPPYVQILASLLVLTAGLFLIMTPNSGSKAPRKLTTGWYDIRSQNANLKEIENASFTRATIFSVVSVFTFTNYFLHSPKSFGLWEISAVCVFLLIGAQFWQQTIVARKRVMLFDELHVELESPVLAVDKEYKAKVRQRVCRDTKIVSCDIGIVGHKTNNFGPVLSENWYQNTIDKNIDAKSEFKFEQAFNISSSSEGDAFCLVVRTKSDAGLQEWSFPLQVNRLNEPKSEP
ncbi:MAG: hypothetical protein SFY67_02115 [Candidatus Melainabacteria bacterium]|nr:hypothetical protein [Candidatus Melainabacteria bacterium]